MHWKFSKEVSTHNGKSPHKSARSLEKWHRPRAWQSLDKKRLKMRKYTDGEIKGVIERKLEKHKTIEGDHWIWTGFKDRDGYGRELYRNHRSIGVHRLSMYVYRNFDIDSPSMALHKPECNR